MKSAFDIATTQAPCIVQFSPGRATIDRLRPVPIKTKHPSLSLWNAKAIMWGQG